MSGARFDLIDQSFAFVWLKSKQHINETPEELLFGSFLATRIAFNNRSSKQNHPFDNNIYRIFIGSIRVAEIKTTH